MNQYLEAAALLLTYAVSGWLLGALLWILIVGRAK